ncbi:MAG: hypothetical protein H0W71_02800 [Sphingomonas sp.]|nr:hypothetical protein [Sphingomonas sp.]
MDACALAPPEGIAGERPLLAGKEVAGFDLRQPRRELVEVVLDFLEFGKGELFQPLFLLDLGKEGSATLVEFAIFARTIRAETFDSRFVVGAGGLRMENGGLSALSPHRFRKLQE